MLQKEGNISAILGPTNTGKTFYAFERFMSFKSGLFGFPLRLLARENYDKAIKKIGFDKVALVTGEEKIIPKNAKYFFCTVESMPIDLKTECVVIDEVQLASDYERGHIFTDRILNLRGEFETIFLGSLTIKNILKKIFPDIKIKTRERFSNLSFSKKHNISKLDPRSAVIAFNINKVYEIAELIKSQKGGAAVVLGSLSPRTRNAQVDIYENKKVEYLVATDAIGMGLNLNISNVLFSSLKKFDGRYNRNLHPSEIGQIAGRAGRYLDDGTFGFTKDIGKIDPLIINSVENHSFKEINKIYWRNFNINFDSVKDVFNSLKQSPIKNFYIHKKNAEDEICFRTLSNDKDISKFLIDSYNVKLLWDVCCIPDFQKIMNDNYLELLKNIFLNLIKNNSFIPEDWIIERISRLEDYSGGIDELSRKISNIRTWTYISNQYFWLKDKEYWQNKTRNIEDNLSDQLHERLTNRFVDFSASYFVENKNSENDSKIEINEDKSITLNKEIFGYINGFQLKLLDKSKSISLFSHNHVIKKIRIMINDKVSNFIDAPEESINLGNIGDIKLEQNINIFWGDEPIGILIKGKDIFNPIAEVINSKFLESDKKEEIQIKLQKWIDNKIISTLKPIRNTDNNLLSSNVRLITYNLFNNLGSMMIEDYKKDLKKIDDDDKSQISKLGIRIGAKFFFIPNLMKKNAIELNAILWKVFNNDKLVGAFPLPKDGRVSFISEIEMPKDYWFSIGYICINKFAVRIDVFERIFFLARQKIKLGPFIESSDMMNPVGCNSEQLSNILLFCGFDSIVLGNEKKLFFFKIKKNNQIVKLKNKPKSEKKITKNKPIKTKIPKKKKIDPNSPFAVLEKLL